MANPIIPSGSRSRANIPARPDSSQPNRESNPDILDLDDGRHTAFGDWVEDRPTNVTDNSLESFGRSQLGQINRQMGQADESRGNDISGQFNTSHARQQHAFEDERRRREEAVAEEQRKADEEKRVEEEERADLERKSKENIKNAITGLRLDEE